MPEKLLQHRHCKVCGKAVQVNQELCSERCKRDWENIIKKRRWTLYLFYIMIVIFIIVLIVQLKFTG